MLQSPRFGIILECLQSDSSRFIALAALYNISLDYEPAQQALRERDLFLELVSILESCSHNPMMVHHLSGLLSFASEDLDVSRSPDMVLKALLQLSSLENIAIDELLPIINILFMHLKQERFQRLLFNADLFEVFLLMVLRLFGYEIISTALPSTFTWNPPPEDEREDIELLQTSAIAALRDLSSFAAFFEKYPLESTTTNTWLSWLNSDNPELQVITCCLLSNLAREKEHWAVQMVTTYGAHRRLGELSACEVDDRVPLAALELLLQLARSPQNRGWICNHDFLGQLSRTWSIASNDSGRLIRIHYASVAVLLGLVRDCPQAIIPLVEHTASVIIENPSQAHGSHLQHLMTCFERSSNAQVRTEIAKVVVAVSKALTTITAAPDHTSNDLNADKMWRDCLSVRPAFVTPITTMISTTDDPALQAQSYFTLVIVARHEMGITMVREAMEQPAARRHLLRAAQLQAVETVQDGQDVEDAKSVQQAVLQRSLRDNARCLVKEIWGRLVSVTSLLVHLLHVCFCFSTRFPEVGTEEKDERVLPCPLVISWVTWYHNHS